MIPLFIQLYVMACVLFTCEEHFHDLMRGGFVTIELA